MRTNLQPKDQEQLHFITLQVLNCLMYYHTKFSRHCNHPSGLQISQRDELWWRNRLLPVEVMPTKLKT